MNATEAYARPTMSYYCMYCMKRSAFPIEHKTLGHVCQHCLRAFGPMLKPRKPRQTIVIPKVAKPAPAGRNGVKERRRLRIAERDNWTCQLCGQPVDPNTAGRHRATVDHIKRRQDGGTNRLDNLRLTHQSCNEYREGANVHPYAPPWGSVG